jgi:hypothetical protein
MFIVLLILSVGLIAGGFYTGSPLTLGAGVLGAVYWTAALVRMIHLKATASEALFDWINGGTLAILRDFGGRMEVLDWEMVFSKRAFLDTEHGEFGFQKRIFGIPVAFWVRSANEFRAFDYSCEPVEVIFRNYRFGGPRGFTFGRRRGGLEGSLEAHSNWKVQLVPVGGGPRVTLVDYAGPYNETTRLFMDRIRERVEAVLENPPPPLR